MLRADYYCQFARNISKVSQIMIDMSVESEICKQLYLNIGQTFMKYFAYAIQNSILL